MDYYGRTQQRATNRAIFAIYVIAAILLWSVANWAIDSFSAMATGVDNPPEHAEMHVSEQMP